MDSVLGVAFLLFMLTGTTLSYWALRGEEIRGARWFVPTGLVCAVLGELTGFVFALRIAGGAGPSFMAASTLLVAFALMLFMTFAYSVFLAHCAMKAVFGARSALMSEDAAVVRKKWWAAETAVRAKDFKRAVACYREELEENPKDTETRRRLAEVLVEMMCYDEAVAELQEGIRLSEGDNASALMLRMADVIERHLGDRERSDRLLRELVDLHPKSYYARFARERLERTT